MSVVKTSEGRVRRWVLVTVVAVGLAGVTGWMLAIGDRGVQVAAILGFPIAVLGMLVAAVGQIRPLPRCFLADLGQGEPHRLTGRCPAGLFEDASPSRVGLARLLCSAQ
jgi:hypothetical protein